MPWFRFAALTMALATLAATTAPLAFEPQKVANMNGEYLLSQTPGADHTQQKFPSRFSDYPRGVRYFDVYSPPVETLYSQVFWKGLDPVSLPDDVVRRYAGGKGMAVVGYEIDQVRRTPTGDVSVPINVAYNHHFESTMIGAKSRFEKIEGPDDPRIPDHMRSMGHGIAAEDFVAVDIAPSHSGLPSQQQFGGGNGGEYRKTFHGFAPGFAQVIESPTQLQVTPMMIDTWHRDEMKLTGSPFVSGPVPRNSLAPNDTIYSGLLECPVTTRLQKDVAGTYAAISNGQCPDMIQTAGECFSAAARALASTQAVGRQVNATVDDTTKPAGCSAEFDSTSGAITVTFNRAVSAAADCGADVSMRSGGTNSLVTLNVTLDLVKKSAAISISGPDGVWFGVGFNATAMKDAPWAVIVDGQGEVTERKLSDQNPGKELQQSLTVVSSLSAGGRRIVHLQRPMKGATPDHYSFEADQSPLLSFINAVGNGPKLSYHKDKTPSTLALLPVKGSSASGACICASRPVPFGSGRGFLRYVPVDGQPGEAGRPTSVSFSNSCAPQPRGDLLTQRNPTCDIRTYTGGQLACHHMFSLLDADQDIPWADRPIQYHLKFRFWYQDYNQSYHTNVERSEGSWDIGAGPHGVGVEYDVPQCRKGMMGCAKSPDGTWVHQITGTFMGKGQPVAAHMHCHAPSCLSMAVYNNHTGELICEERPVYGATGRIDRKDMDEPGFITVPPCLWGSPEFGLARPPDLDGVALRLVKTANATYGHHGEMVHGQIYFIDKLSKVSEAGHGFYV